MSEVQQAKLPSTGAPLSILLSMTAVTGMVDAVSYLALGHVFTANMTGNIVLLGFAIGGAPGISILRSLVALACFAIGAVSGGRMTARTSSKDLGRTVTQAFSAEAVLMLAAATISLGLAAPFQNDQIKLAG